MHESLVIVSLALITWGSGCAVVVVALDHSPLARLHTAADAVAVEVHAFFHPSGNRRKTGATHV